MAFSWTRTIRFADTDAAGVVYFANVLSICHEAYEESLKSFGLDIKAFFTNPPVAYPIVQASIDFKRPMFCGDRVIVTVNPQIVDEYSFQISYVIQADTPEMILATATTKHVCIDGQARKRQQLDASMIEWVEYCQCSS